MNIQIIVRYKAYLEQVDQMALDARQYDNGMAFLGYTSSFKLWVETVANDVIEETPSETHSGAYEAAIRAQDDLIFPLDVRFESLVENLKLALERAIHCHSSFSIENDSFDQFIEACAKILADPAETMAELCRQFASSMRSTTKPGDVLLIRFTVQSPSP